jgi:hypothetical protein
LGSGSEEGTRKGGGRGGGPDQLPATGRLHAQLIHPFFDFWVYTFNQEERSPCADATSF